MKRIRVSAALMLLLVDLSACSTTPIKRGDTAVIAIGVDPGHFNPAITTAAQVHAVADSLFNGLVALDRDSNPIPDLATDWTIEDEGRTYVFRLASGVRWHDGQPFTSADVKFTFEKVLLRHHARTKAGLGGVLERVEAPDPHTAIFRFRRPYAALLQRLDVTEAPILPAHVFGDEDADIETHPANLAPIGTGPFRLALYRRDDRIELVRNHDYFKPNLPRLERLVFRVIPDASTQLLALERGEVDYVSSVRHSDGERLRREKGFTVVSSVSGPGGGNCVMTWIFNLERPVLADIRVRRALAQAVDRRQIVERVLFGEGRVPDAPISSGIGWAQAKGSLDRYPFDPSRAESLLDEAGLKELSGGKRASLDIVHFASFLKYGEILRQQLAEVGVDLRVRALERAATVQAIYVDRDFDTGLVSYCQGLDPEIGTRRMYDPASIGPVPFSNGAAYRNDEVASLFDQAAVHTDREERATLYRRAQDIIVAELPYWWLAETTNVSVYRSTFLDFAPWSGQFAESASVVSTEP
jgi:peptide/nickel transport system substrate-binding protein